MGMCCSGGMNPGAQLRLTQSAHLLRDIKSKFEFKFKDFGEIFSEAGLSSWECVVRVVWILVISSGWHNPLIFSGTPPATTGLMPVTSSSAFVLHSPFFFYSSSSSSSFYHPSAHTFSRSISTHNLCNSEKPFNIFLPEAVGRSRVNLIQTWWDPNKSKLDWEMWLRCEKKYCKQLFHKSGRLSTNAK